MTPAEARDATVKLVPADRSVCAAEDSWHYSAVGGGQPKDKAAFSITVLPGLISKDCLQVYGDTFVECLEQIKDNVALAAKLKAKQEGQA